MILFIAGLHGKGHFTVNNDRWRRSRSRLVRHYHHSHLAIPQATPGGATATDTVTARISDITRSVCLFSHYSIYITLRARITLRASVCIILRAGVYITLRAGVYHSENLHVYYSECVRLSF